MKIDNSGPPYFINTFDQALNWIGAKPNGETRGQEASGTLSVGTTRDADRGPRGREGDAGEDALYVQQAHVRAVRRENRPDRKGRAREVVVVDFVASTETQDSHGTIIRSNWQLDRYKANPTLLWMHCRWSDTPAIGTVENLRKEGTSHCGTAVFDDTTQFDRDVAAKYENGTLKGFSIGFYPHTVRFETHNDDEVLILDDIEILEISCVNVPSNPEALAKARAALRTRLVTSSPALPAPVQPTPAAPAAGDTMKDRKRIDIDARAVRSDGEGMSADASCPHCNEPVEVNARSVPTPKKATDEIAALTDRAAKAEQALTRETAEKDAVEKRAALLDTKLATAEQTIQRMREDRVSAEIELRVGKKLDPTEKDDQVRLALLDLANQTPDPEQPTRTLGDKAFAARLAKIDARRDIGLLGAPITAGGKENQNANAPAVRSIADKIDSAVAEDLKHK